MNKEQLQQEYQNGRRDFSNLDLSDLDLTRINLEGANLTGTDLSGTNLRDAKLTDANLTSTNLSCACLVWTYLANTNLTGVNLSNTELRSVNLTHANLKQANLKGTILKQVSLENANLEESNLEGAIFSYSSLNEVNLTSANLKSANLKNIYLYKAILKNANLTDVNLTNTDLEEADLTGANLTNSKVDGVGWRGCKLDNISVLPEKEALTWQIHNIRSQNLDLSKKNLSKLNLRKANLAGANLTGTDLSDTNLRDANLTDANLTGANLSAACLCDANLTNANLTNANLSDTHLNGTNFNNANLTNATLTNIEFEQTNFKEANLQGIQFEGTSFFSTNLIDAKNLPSPVISPLFVPANHPDIDLVNSIRLATEGLVCEADFDCPYDIFLWNRVIRGEFKLEQFIKEMGHLNMINLQSLHSVKFDTEELMVYCQIILENVQEYLSDLELYQVQNNNTIIVIGRTAIGDWFGTIIDCSWYRGISNHINTENQISEVLRKDDAAITKAEHLNLISAVEKLGAKIKQLVWSLSEDRDIMLHKLLLAVDLFALGGVEYCDYIIQEDRYEGYKEDEMDEEDTIDKEKRKVLAQLVFNNLSNILVYFIRKDNYIKELYLIGKTPNQDWLGIHTEVMWS